MSVLGQYYRVASSLRGMSAGYETKLAVASNVYWVPGTKVLFHKSTRNCQLSIILKHPTRAAHQSICSPRPPKFLDPRRLQNEHQPRGPRPTPP